MRILLNFRVSDYGKTESFSSIEEMYNFFSEKVLNIIGNILYCKCEGGWYSLAEISFIEDNEQRDHLISTIEIFTDIMENSKNEELDKIRNILNKEKIDINSVMEELYEDLQKQIAEFIDEYKEK